jgi:tRNA(fMet)-specific endonuclease VapC
MATPSVLLDTNVCITILRGDMARIPASLERLQAVDAAISSITLAELEVGAHKGDQPQRQRQTLHLLMARISAVPFDDAAARHYGEIRAHLEKRGTPIGPLDTLIAAHARSLGVMLITGNIREFRRVPGLLCREW